MNTIGIIAEYNPFHNGHRYHIEQSKLIVGQDSPVVSVMSGNFVQRGDSAIADKWIRTQIALRGGADLVLELPTLWAASSAESFASGAVQILSATGVVDILSFGSEDGKLDALQCVCDCLESEPFRRLLKMELEKGLSFPAARQNAVTELLGENADCMKTANNSLGIEYLKALRKEHSPIHPITVKRIGAGHDDSSTVDTLFVSASRLRHLLYNEEPVTPYLTVTDSEILARDPAGLQYCPRAVMARLRTMTAEDFARIPDCSEGLDRKLASAVQKASSPSELYSLIKSKRYTLSRIRRIILWAFLGLQAADRPSSPPYIRVLGFSDKGRDLLRRMKTTATLPVITKPAHIDRLPEEAQRVFRLEAQCTALYDLTRKQFGVLPGPNEFTCSPIRF